MAPERPGEEPPWQVCEALSQRAAGAQPLQRGAAGGPLPLREQWAG